MNRALLRQWLDAGYLEQHVHHPTPTGTPQGGLISPVLMNLTLDGLEPLLRQHFPPRHGHKVNFVRYADDFIITGNSPELLENEVTPLVTQFLKERGLALSREKTRLTHVTTGFDFLGKHIQKYSNGKLLTKPSRANVQAFLSDIKATFNHNLHTPPERLIWLLNPKIRGWAQFHRSSASKEIFNYVDARIFHQLEHWMIRRHPRKGLRWCYARYFTVVGDRTYVFQASYPDRRGQPRTIRLAKAADTPVKRHVKIKAAANPFDPNREPYFEARNALQMKESLCGYGKLLRLWQQQDGKCPSCGALITKATGWHLHHKVRMVDGGDESMATNTSCLTLRNLPRACPKRCGHLRLIATPSNNRSLFKRATCNQPCPARTLSRLLAAYRLSNHTYSGRRPRRFAQQLARQHDLRQRVVRESSAESGQRQTARARIATDQANQICPAGRC